MSSNKKYWKSVEELNENSSIVETLRQNEFVEEIPTDKFLGDKTSLENSTTTRRDFLKYVGFSTAAATLASCEGPVVKSIPYVVQPESIVPGVANYYATTIADGFDFASILIKTREGRPIKVENNTLAKGFGAANARVQASVLSLYDNTRLKGPLAGGKVTSWESLDKEVASKLSSLGGKQIVLLTQSFASPSTSRLIQEFKTKFGAVSHIVYDAISYSEALDAYKDVYGVRALADYDFEKAATIVSVGADFLGDWQGGGYSAGYAKGRVPKNGTMSRHIQFESIMSLSGANADKRVPVTPAEQKQVLSALYSYIAGSGTKTGLTSALNEVVLSAAKQLKKAGSKGLLVCGLSDKDAQLVVLKINKILGSSAFNESTPRKLFQGDALKTTQLIKNMNSGQIGAVLMAGVNPVFTHPEGKLFAEGLKKVSLSVSFGLMLDETATLCQYVAPSTHYLESWCDAELKKGTYSLMQPTIRPLFDSRSFQDSLLIWTGNSNTYHDYIKNVWTSSILKGSSLDQALHDGVLIKRNSAPVVALSKEEILVDEEPSGLSLGPNFESAARRLATSSKSNTLELVLYTKTSLGDGQQAGNPWLQEMPDPITRTSWDNYVTVSSNDAQSLGLINENVANGGLNGSYVTVKLNENTSLKNVPVIIQPGQATGSIGLALGYGRVNGLKEEMQVGVNAYTLYKNQNIIQSVTLIKEEGEHEFACVQLHNTLMGRGDIIKETSLEVFNTQKASVWNKMPMVSKDHMPFEVTSPEVDLWDEFDRSIGHHFNLSIDLNACTGCGACVIACHAENNVPVVGKSEIRRSRDMHWLRIDRYYSSESSFDGDSSKKHKMDGLGDSLSQFGEMELPADNPQVAFQPVMCQHCNHAPCETVCPVAATSHGRQGQNHMAYNRCVGTRYCANNCPYKVRRFNWFLYSKNDEFDYHMNNDLGRMVLNPDVTVRSRGVMEKCSMCMQMTQKTILEAKRDGRAIKDGEFKTACSAACANGAMSFGDINDKSSAISALKDDDRMYHLLEHVGTKPNVIYQVKVRNTKEA